MLCRPKHDCFTNVLDLSLYGLAFETCGKTHFKVLLCSLRGLPKCALWALRYVNPVCDELFFEAAHLAFRESQNLGISRTPLPLGISWSPFQSPERDVSTGDL